MIVTKTNIYDIWNTIAELNNNNSIEICLEGIGDTFTTQINRVNLLGLNSKYNKIFRNEKVGIEVFIYLLKNRFTVLLHSTDGTALKFDKNCYGLFYIQAKNDKDLINKVERISIKGVSFEDVRDVQEMFSQNSNLREVIIDNFNIPNLENCDSMFRVCRNLEKVELRNFKAKHIKSMDSMFMMCSKLTDINIEDWEIEDIDDCDYMFCTCLELKSLNFRKIKAPSLKSMDSMFYNCRKLENIDISSLDSKRVFSLNKTFMKCVKLRKIDLTGLGFDKDIDLKKCIEYTSLNKDTIKLKDEKYIDRFVKTYNEKDMDFFDKVLKDKVGVM